MNIARLLPVILASGTLFAVNALADFHDHIGIQLWSLRATTLTKGVLASLDQIKAFGITEVEGAALTANMTPELVRAAYDQRGLKLPSVHAGYDDLTKNLPALVQAAKTLGVKYVICPWIPHEGAFGRKVMEQAAADFNRAGEAFRAAGIKFGYHPHGYEFVANGTAGETLLDDLIRATKPENVCYEMDVFWVVHGGGSPVKLMEKYSNRWVALHVKDLRKGAPILLPKPESAPDADNVAVGGGGIDWKAVIGTAEKIGVTYYFIEDETPAPLENIPASLAYLKALKL
jgi:sugar phosphate isomerase/epimerase